MPLLQSKLSIGAIYAFVIKVRMGWPTAGEYTAPTGFLGELVHGMHRFFPSTATASPLTSRPSLGADRAVQLARARAGPITA
jgi:hypothetical protein